MDFPEPPALDGPGPWKNTLMLFLVPEEGSEVTVKDLIRPLNCLIDLFESWAPDNPQDALQVARQIHLLWLEILQAFYGDESFYDRPAVAPKHVEWSL
jgi:hypothetical protein